MERRKVLAIRTHVGVQFRAEMITNLSVKAEPGSSQKSVAEMELHPAGVEVVYQGAQLIIPYSNLAFIQVEPTKEQTNAVVPKSYAGK